jgi:hypothetical protein
MVRGGLVFGVLAAILAVASPARGASAPCWQQLVHDWADGRIDATYRVSCYRQALARLPEDLRIYSTAGDDIRAALARKLTRSSEARSLAISPQSIAHPGSASRFPVSAVVAVAILGGGLLALVALPAVRARRNRR